ISQFDIITTSSDEAVRNANDALCSFAMIEQLRARLVMDITCRTFNADDYERTLISDDVSFLIGTGGRDEYELMRGTVDGCGKQGLFFFADSLGRGFVIILLPGETNSIPKWMFDKQNDKNSQTSSSANPFVKMHLDNVAAN